MLAASAAPDIAGPQAQVLVPVEGPLTIDGRYLGTLSGAVDVQGRGVVDGPRLLELMKGVLGPEALKGLSDLVAAAPRVAMTDIRTDTFSLAFDPLSLTFIATVGMTARGRRDLSLSQGEVADPSAFDAPAKAAAGANITVGQSYSHDRNELSPLLGAMEFYANLGGFDGVTFTSGVGYDGASAGRDRWRRREARLSKDLFGSAIRLTAGEFAPSVNGFQGSSRILGVSAERAYGVIRPFQNIRPSGRRQFILDRPSFVEVEVNGVLVQRLQLEAGPYSLADFPFGRGANTIRLLIEDPTGRREIANFDLFDGAGLLDRGILDFGASLGVAEAPRREFAYGNDAAASGFARLGLTDALTVGVNGQAVYGRAAQAGGMAAYASRIGLVQTQVAASRNRSTRRMGYAASIDYLKEFSVRARDDFRLAVSAQSSSRAFQDAFSEFADNPEKWRVAAQSGWRLHRWTLNLGGALSKGRGIAPDQRSVDLTAGRSFGRFGLNLASGWRETDPGRKEARVAIGLTMRLGARSTASARYDSATRLREVGYDRASTGELGDISGSLRIGQDRDRSAVSGDARYIHNRFEGQLSYNRLTASSPNGPSSQDSIWRASTFLGYADGAFGIGRPAREGFVIATRHPTLKKSNVALTVGNGRVVSRSGLLGPALAGIDRAYGVNRFEVAVQPLPDGYDLGSGLVSTFPGYGNGYRFRVGSDASHMVMGVIVGPKGPLPLISGTIETLDGDGKIPPRAFFTNRSGRFVGERLAPGRYRLVVGGQPIGEFSFTAGKGGIVDVGQIETRAR